MSYYKLTVHSPVKELSNSPRAAAILLHTGSFICCAFPTWKTWVKAAQAAQPPRTIEEVRGGGDVTRKPVAIWISSQLLN